jgi:hypothetical protein
MDLNRPWVAPSRAATQERPSILWNPKVHYRIHKSPSLVHTLLQIYPVHTIPCYLSKIHFNIIRHLRLGPYKPPRPVTGAIFTYVLVFILLTFPPIPIYIHLLTIHTTCPVYLILFDLIIIMILGKVCCLRSPSLCSFLQPPVTSPLRGPAPCSQTL